MLKQYSQLMVSLLVAADALAISAAWLLSYWLRFQYLPAPKGTPGLYDKYLPMLPLVLLAHIIIFYRLRLYRPRRDDAIWRETVDVIKAFVVAIVACILIDYALPQSNKISRQFIATYAIIGTTLFATLRLIARATLRMLRRRGWNRRTALIVGSGRNAQKLCDALGRHTWTGIEVVAFVDDPAADRPTVIKGVPVQGPLSALEELIEQASVDMVFIALSGEQAARTAEVLTALETCVADVRLVPEISPVYSLRPHVSTFEDLAVLGLRQTPLYGWNALLKRAFDLVVGGMCLLIAALPMTLIALAIKITDWRGPVFYRQRRMGLDGREFMMLKFRTMRVDAEARGPVWSQKQDPRRTRLGGFLRQTSLDELPNLFNVIAGQMSLVGPRPERPEFIEQFKREIPRYMLRHKVKAGMTGFAQMRGWRGDTSLKKRIQHDVHYINHWSLGLDLRILLRTVFGVWFSRHET